MKKTRSESTLKTETLAHSLHERIKELTCLYGIAQLIEKHASEPDKVGQGVADLLPGSWQYPEIACARVTMLDKEYTSAHFQQSRWRLAAEIWVSQKRIGKVEVFYSTKKPEMAEGPFVHEERLLIDAVAGHLGQAWERNELEHSLQERIKELTCLYRVSQSIEKHGVNLDIIFQEVADLLPESWQYPEITSGRIVYREKQFITPDFSESRWLQKAQIMIGGETAGAIEVYYGRQMPEAVEGPFLQEERLLIDAIAERLSKACTRISIEQQLIVERAALNNMNITLREVLSKVEDEKTEIGERIQANVDKVIMPILYALEQDLPSESIGYARLLQRNLKEIVSPFTKQIVSAYQSLTPVEIQICNMIRSGLSTKDIARIRNISGATVSVHREHIRKKLGLKNQKLNLRSYLDSLAQHKEPAEHDNIVS